jgi:hypothetical protein
MQVLAAVMANGDQPFTNVLVDGIARLRRGMTAVMITPSLERSWIRPLSGLRGRGVETVIISLDAPAFAANDRRLRELPDPDDESVATEQRAVRALHHALAEHDLAWHTVVPGEPIAAQLVSAGPRPLVAA